MANVASRMRLRRSRWASDPSSDSASTATFITWRGRESDPEPCAGCAGCDIPDMWSATPSSCVLMKTIRIQDCIFFPQHTDDTGVCCPNGGRLDARTLALLEHVLVRSTAFSPKR